MQLTGGESGSEKKNQGFVSIEVLDKGIAKGRYMKWEIRNYQGRDCEAPLIANIPSFHSNAN